MNELALFAGAGGGLLATRWLLGWRTVCYVEIEPYCIEVIKARIGDGWLDDAPIWDDARTFDGRPWRGCVDIVTAGFPCQPFSTAGLQQAQQDERNLWPDTIRIIREVQPRFCLLENVPGLLTGRHGYFGTILKELAESGYDASWRVLSAAEVGAPHKRDRVWIVAHAGSERRQQITGSPYGNEATHEGWPPQDYHQPASNGKGHTAGQIFTHLAHANGKPAQWLAEPRQECNPWHPEPELGRVADGVAHRVDRLRAIGNGQVPAVVREVWGLLND